MMIREEMLDKVIKMRGFEDEVTIEFAKSIANEKIADADIENVFIAICALPIFDEDEDF